MNITNKTLLAWVEDCKKLYKPQEVVWYDGSKQAYQNICDLLVEDGTFTPLNKEEYPNSFWAKSDPSDVARAEKSTFICSTDYNDAGPTNNWVEPDSMRKRLQSMMRNCMQGKTMYVIPYLMGPEKSPYSKFGVEITDSPYVVANMHLMTLTGEKAIEELSDATTQFVTGIHSIGTLNPDHRYIAHFPEDQEIISYNTNYGGNVLQAKKCFALRLASRTAREEGWLAEHMLILCVTRPDQERFYIAAAFPSACGKTNLAMLQPPEEYKKAGWKVETIGDDIAWLHFGPGGRLYAINPERGFFGVAAGTSMKTNPNAIKTLQKGNTIFTNTALDPKTKTPWWDKLGPQPEKLINWLGIEHKEHYKYSPDHANARFTVPADQCPTISSEWQNPYGVPISAIIFGGRRSKTAPLVMEARDWRHGVFLGASMASEQTAAAEGQVGRLRQDPMAMRPFLGYHIGDYFKHWLHLGNRPRVQLPKIFQVNWFKTDDNNDLIWPGFSENIRVLEWIFKRVRNECNSVQSEIGRLPELKDLNLDGLDLTIDQTQELFEIIPKNWRRDLVSQMDFFTSIGHKLPEEIYIEHELLCQRLGINLQEKKIDYSEETVSNVSQ